MKKSNKINGRLIQVKAPDVSLRHKTKMMDDSQIEKMIEVMMYHGDDAESAYKPRQSLHAP